MDVVYNHVCGLDVHKKNIVACTITPEGKEIRTFEAMTDDLILLVDWIKAKGCNHVAMESTALTGSQATICWNSRELKHWW